MGIPATKGIKTVWFLNVVKKRMTAGFFRVNVSS